MSAASTRREGTTRPAAFVAANLSFLAAAVHAWAAPSLLVEWWAYGCFFIAVAIAQAGIGVALLRRPWPVVYQAGIWANVLVVATYVMTRSAGIPIGPLTGVIEPAGLIDVASVAAEMAAVVALVSLLADRVRTFTVDALLFVGVSGWAARLWLWN